MKKPIPCLAALALLLLATAGAAAEEAPPLEAFATWTLDGVMVRSAPEEMTLVGSMRGPVFVDSGQGPMFAGLVICPGTLVVNTVDHSQHGEGVCSFRAKDGAEAFGTWACDGYHLVGCKGSFTFTGGTERLAGVSGGSELMIRAEVMEVAKAGAHAQVEEILGIMVWQNLVATAAQ